MHCSMGKEIRVYNIIIKYETIIAYALIVLKIAVILILTKIIVKVLSSIIERFFKKQRNSRFGISDRKAATLSELIKSLLRYIIYFIAVMWIFEAVGFDIRTVIAVTSIAGVAIGFGAQNLVKDVITGFFILFEDQFAVGDYISIEDKSGIVEVLGLRITKIRDFSGDLHIIPNGSITKVTNKSRGNMRAMVDINISYEEDIDRAVKIMKETADELRKELDYIVEGPEVIGVAGFGEYGITIRTIAKTLPMKQWDVEMEYRKRIKKALGDADIKIPYTKRVITDRGEV